MDDSLKSKTALVYDHGNYMEVAMRLAREFGKVYYFKPWQDAGPQTIKLIVGDGYEEFERVKSWLDVKKEVDLFVFPEIYDGDLQLDLVEQGYRVWGSRRAEDYEYKRGLFAKTLKEVGLPVVPFKKCIGITALRDYLSEGDDKWVKVEMRGDRETWHHINMKLSEPILVAIAYQYQAVKEYVPFYVFDSIESIVEVAYDGYMVTGREQQVQFPEMGFLGYEDKNLSHILVACDYDKMPEEVSIVNNRFAPKLAERWFRSQWGTEIKKVEGDGIESVRFLDATCRMPSPPGEIVLEIIENLGEIFYHGAEGDLIQMELADEVGVQVMLYSDWAGANHLPIEIPDDIRQWVKLSDCCRVDGMDWIIHNSTPEDPIAGFRKNCGGVVALGKTIEDAIELVKERCEQIVGFDTTMQINSLSEVLRRIKEGEKQGIDFVVDVPEPESVMT